MSQSLLEAFRVDQPRADDLVGNPLLIAGSGGGFEAVIVVRILAGNGQVLVQTSVMSTNLMGSSRVDLQACKLEYSIVSPK